MYHVQVLRTFDRYQLNVMVSQRGGSGGERSYVVEKSVATANLISPIGLERSSPLSSVFIQCHCEKQQLAPVVIPVLLWVCCHVSGPQTLQR